MKAKDHRPKVISFSTKLNGLNIAARQSVLWPCHAFNVSIPQKKKSGLNVFEETVLKLTEIESGNTEKIARLTCLKTEKGKEKENGEELVAFIQNRLNQLGLLTDRYELSEQGRELLNEWQNKQGENLEYVAGTVFVDLLSGKLLPYISMGQLSYKKISKISDNGFIDFLNNPTNEESRVSARQIRPTKDSFWKVTPNSNDIIRAIKEFNKKYKRSAMLNENVNQYPPPVPMAEAISLHENPELVYLHCYALIQVGNSDLLVTDGWGLGFSESFANYLTSQNWQWVIALKSKGLIEKLTPDQDHEDTEYESSEAGGLKKYPLIIRPLRDAQKKLSEANKIDINSSNSESEFTELTCSAVVKLYNAIEWALKFIVSDNPVTDWERLFSSQSHLENGKVLLSFAAKLGFEVSDRVKALLQVKSGKIRAIESGIAEMQPLLAMGLAGAINDSSHPFHRLAMVDSGGLDFINTLKAIRDPASHGSSTGVELSLETLERYCERTVRFIQTLIPDITEEKYAYKTGQARDIDQTRLKARIELDKSLGLGFVQTISPSLREELIKVTVSSLWPTMYENNYIVSLTSIMQLSLLEAAKGRSALGHDQTKLKHEAIEKFVKFGFYPAPDAIPKHISGVDVNRFYSAVQGSSTTLGAHLLALFLLGTESELTMLQKSDPDFVDFVADLLLQRKHANEPGADLSQDDRELLKNNIFKRIKIIAEVF